MWTISSEGLIPPLNFGRFMSYNRFHEILSSLSVANENAADLTDPWWKVRPLMEAFTENRKSTIYPSWNLVIDESISAWTGNGMPHVSYIPREPEPCGAELKCLADGSVGVMLVLEIQEGKERMNQKRHHELGATTACTVRLM